MKKLLEIQNQYIVELKRAITKPLELLRAAKYAAGNHISDCGREGCTSENRCNYCKAWSKIWDDIDAYLKDNDETA